jgi:acetolactate synthase-1/2/3 large subunit
VAEWRGDLMTIHPVRNVASYAVELVSALGTNTVFTLTGGMAMHLNRAVATQPGLRAVYCQHEQACVASAEGYAKASDFRRAGFAVITAGPGVSNCVTSLLSAYGDSTPLIVLAGQVKTADIDYFGTRTHGIQEIPSQDLIRPCVKRFTRLAAANYRADLVATLAEAFRGRPGPVFIEIPLDVQGTPVADTAGNLADDKQAILQSLCVDPVAANRDALAGACDQLLRSRRPLLYVGNGCRIAGVESAVLSLIEQHALPSVFSWLSFDILPRDAPWHFGCPGALAPISSNQILAHADMILFLGARLDLATTAFQRASFGAQAVRYVVDIDSNELAKFASFPNTVCVQAHLRCLPEAMANLPSTVTDPLWLDWCKQQQASYLDEESSRLASDRLTVYNLARRLSRWSEDKVFVPASSGYAEETFSRFFSPGRGARFFNGAALGSMGLGLPHALGAAFASPRRVLCLEGDGGLMLNLQELATLSHYTPKGFVLFILNNGGYESIRASQSRHFGQASGVDRHTGLLIPDFQKIAAAFELDYICVDSLGALDCLLSHLAATDRPVMVDLQLEKTESRGPSVQTRLDRDGKPYTTPLEQLAW